MWIGLTEKVLKHPWATIISTLLFTACLGAGLKDIHADTDVTNDLPTNIPAKELYDRIDKIFPSKEMVVVGIKSDALYDAKGIERLRSLTRHVEDIPGVDSVLSPTNARIITATDGLMQVKAAAEPMPSSPKEVEGFRQKLLSQPLYRGTIVTTDAKAFLLLVFVKSEAKESDVAKRLVELASDNKLNQGFKLHITGRPAATYWAKVLMGRDMGMLSGVAILVVLLILALTFRSFRGVLLPFSVVVFSVIATLGLMGWLKIPISHSTEVLPILLIAIGVADGIHIIKGFYASTRSGLQAFEAARSTMEDLNRPVILTSVTTAVSFMALNTSGIRSIMLLGMFTAFGVMVALLISLTFIPAMLSILPAPKYRPETKTRMVFAEQLAQGWGSFLVARRKTVFAAIVLILAGAAVGAYFVPIEMSNLDNFKPDHPFRVDTQIVNENFAGASSLIIVVEGEKPDAIKDPVILHKMDKLENYLRTLPHVGAVQSITGFIKQMNKVLHGDKADQYRIPDIREEETSTEYVEQDGKEVEKQISFHVPGKDLIAQYLQLYEMSAKPDDFANLVTYDYSTAKITVFIDTDKASLLGDLNKKVRSFISKNFGGTKAELTGMVELIRAVNEMVIGGQAWSIATSLLLVFILSSLLFRSVVLGLFSTMPLFFSLFLNFGVMGVRQIALNVMTMATSSVAVGVGIDYAIHFIHRYQTTRLQGMSYSDAVPASMKASGVAIIINAMTVAAGFSALMFSEFSGVAQMGFLIALTMVTSAFAALTILPVLFVTLRPKAFKGKEAQMEDKHE